jgi:Holliday junction DNA helicase RuvA
MIAHVSGTIVEKVDSSLIVDVQGVGYEVNVPLNDFEQYLLKQEVKLYTHHHIREQSQELFGFSSLAAKRLFELLISVQGVGPKAALAILGLGSAETVRGALAAGDSSFIQKANGVGKRGAERVVVDLKDKVGLPGKYQSGGITQTTPQGDDALDALMALGFNIRQASEALESVDQALPADQKIREALKGMQ